MNPNQFNTFQLKGKHFQMLEFTSLMLPSLAIRSSVHGFSFASFLMQHKSSFLRLLCFNLLIISCCRISAALEWQRDVRCVRIKDSLEVDGELFFVTKLYLKLKKARKLKSITFVLPTLSFFNQSDGSFASLVFCFVLSVS